MKIGVFDSGVGGLSVANAIIKALPQHEVVFVNDTKNVPYGTKKPEELIQLVVPILKNLEVQGCSVIVVACNTVSTTLIKDLRNVIKIPLIAIEPMVKPAAEQTQSGTIAVCATPTTLASERYRWFKETYAKNVRVVEPDCSDWTQMIETQNIDRQKITNIIESVYTEGCDVIVLGCTHYHWIEDLINEIISGRAVVLQPEQPVISQLEKILEQQT